MTDLKKFRETLTDEQVYSVLAELEADPRYESNAIVSRSVCHNGVGEGNHKLFYYSNSHLFHCYSGCTKSSFDIVELISKVKDLSINQAVNYLENSLGIIVDTTIQSSKPDNEFRHIKHDIEMNNRLFDLPIALPIKTINLSQFLQVPIEEWEKEGISATAQKKYGICWDPIGARIVIPHYDRDSNLIGVRERNLNSAQIAYYGKYRPFRSGDKEMYNHPLGKNLYGFDLSWENCKKYGEIILFESEKSCIKYETYFPGKNISAAICGSNLTTAQLALIRHTCGDINICLSLDRDGATPNDPRNIMLKNKLRNLKKGYDRYYNLYFTYDAKGELPPSSAIIDGSQQIFQKLYNSRKSIKILK
jgi:hypothetical protein